MARMSENCWKLLEMAGMARQSWTCIEMAGIPGTKKSSTLINV